MADGLSGSEAEAITPETTEAQFRLMQALSMFDTGEELMFVMDVPYVPALQAPIVLAGETSGAGNAAQQAQYILKDCQPVPSMGDPRSAERVVDPAGMLRNYMESRVKHALDLSAFKNPTLLEGPKHGKMNREVDNKGDVAFGFDPTPEYVGSDRAIFTVEYQGRRYKVIVDFFVDKYVDQNVKYCLEPKLIKVNDAIKGARLELNSPKSALATRR